jgi:hypothetical protein
MKISEEQKLSSEGSSLVRCHFPLPYTTEAAQHQLHCVHDFEIVLLSTRSVQTHK